MEKPRQKYTIEFKQKAVNLSNRYYSTIRAAEEVNTSPVNIRRWKVRLPDGYIESLEIRKALATYLYHNITNPKQILFNYLLKLTKQKFNKLTNHKI
ncbi:hypothetical protein CFS9_39480 [Flavobacterium sp. CFS9]|uniref:Transposase n=1 Tax=Flavobacterium sp. CFS9 TaxID=3143118 RepID=A0AAT9H7E8_9FLAO